jgi:hypothetical protein
LLEAAFATFIEPSLVLPAGNSAGKISNHKPENHWANPEAAGVKLLRPVRENTGTLDLPHTLAHVLLKWSASLPIGNLIRSI